MRARRQALLHKIEMARRRDDARARRFLRAVLLAAGPRGVWVLDLMRLALECDVWWRSVRRARLQLGARVRPHGVWVLPPRVGPGG